MSGSQVFESSINRDDLVWDIDGDNLTISLLDNPEDNITIVNYADSFSQIENVRLEGNQMPLEDLLSTEM